eukprot:2204443-Amphidinium_carterae.1
MEERYEGGLHIYKLYCYRIDDPLAPEKNRELVIEVLASVAAWATLPSLLVIGILNRMKCPWIWCTVERSAVP